MQVRETAGKALTADEEKRLLAACGTRRSRATLPVVTLALHTGMRRGEIQSMTWRQVDFLNRTLTAGDSKTAAGTGRVIPLNDRALVTLQIWATNFGGRQPEHFVFPSEHYGFAGNDRKPHAKTIDPTIATKEVKTGWESAKAAAKVQCRFHDLRHTACTRLLERGIPLPVVASILRVERRDDGKDGETLRSYRLRRTASCRSGTRRFGNPRIALGRRQQEYSR